MKTPEIKRRLAITGSKLKKMEKASQEEQYKNTLIQIL